MLVMSEPDITEFLVVGGGPAGMQAALSLGRVHRDVVLLDDGRYRNATVRHMHNVLGADGTPPTEFRKRVREELAAYDTVTVRDVGATSLAGDATTGFVVHLGDGTDLRARAVVLATGVRDELPDVPGLEQLWGGRAAQCPFCHAHEFAGGRFGILGLGAAAHLSAMLAPIAGSVVVLPLGDEGGAQLPDGSPAGASVTGMRDTGSAVEVALADGSVEVVDVVFTVPTLRQRSPLAAALDLELNESGCVRVDAFQRTSVAGVFAAGDMAHQPAYPMPMASVVAAAAAGQLAAAAALMHVLSS
jgi:thioredoxin reductase